MSSEASNKRYIGLWFPFLTADIWQLKHSACDDDGAPPLVFTETVRSAARLVKTNLAAQDSGLVPGMTLADARARIPLVRAVPYNKAADEAFLEQLADICLAVTPSCAIEAPETLTLDITGCAHLFGGERQLARALWRNLRTQGVSAIRLAAAPTPDMANALARYSARTPVFAHDDTDALRLPAAAMACSADDALALRRAGLKTIGALAERPSVVFSARFTQAFTVKLNRITGKEDRCITPRSAPPLRYWDHRCAEPVASHDVIMGLALDLIQRAGHDLEQRGEGGRAFRLLFFRSDGAIRSIAVETGQPVRASDILMRLFNDRLDQIADPLDPGFGFDALRFEVNRAEPFACAQSSLDQRDETREQLAHLIDRLSTRYGQERLHRLVGLNSHIPEQSSRRLHPSLSVPMQKSADAARSVPSLPRPLHLFDPPQPVDVEATSLSRHAPAKPVNVSWRRVRHEIVHADGPERISDVWWRSARTARARDYWRIETREGRRFWVFRTQTEHRETAPARWFLHGVFP